MYEDKACMAIVVSIMFGEFAARVGLKAWSLGQYLRHVSRHVWLVNGMVSVMYIDSSRSSNMALVGTRTAHIVPF